MRDWPIGLEAAALHAMRTPDQLLLVCPLEHDHEVRAWVAANPELWGQLLREAKPWTRKNDVARIYREQRTGTSGDTAAENEVTVTRIDDDGRSVTRDLPHWLSHSPSGLSWGYHGAGSMDLARSVLLDLTGDPVLSSEQAPAMLAAFLMKDGDRWMLTGNQLLDWLASVHPNDRS